MREIAEAAGVTKPLIYYHFESKERLFSSLLRESIEACRSGGREILDRSGSAAEKLKEVLRRHIVQAREMPEVFGFVYEVLTMPGLLPLGFDYKTEGRRIFEDLVHMIEEGQRRREFCAIDARAVSVVLVSTLGMYVSAVLSRDIETIPADLEENLFELVMHGLEVRAQ
jgi:AcrR family transcriptional regulator